MAQKPTKENKTNEKELSENDVTKETSQECSEPETKEKDKQGEKTEEVVTVVKEKYDELYDKYLRVLAEYDNFKKRTQKEKDEMYSLAVAETIEKLLPVADNLDRAISSLGENESSEFGEGVKMVSKQFFEILAKMGVAEIEALGAQFDPNIHNAVMHIDDDEYDTNVVVEQFMKGYKYKEKVIRHSMVKVAN